MAPIQRRRQLKCLRKTDPAAAHELLARFAPNKSTKERLALAWVLSVNLSDDDKPLLQSLSKDRSQKIKDMAKAYLARLGEYDEGVADELFEELEQGAQGIIFKTTKNNLQRDNRHKLLQDANLFALAGRFKLSLPEFLLALDVHGNERRGGYYDYHRILFSKLVKMISDDQLAKIARPLLDRIDEQDEYYYTTIRPRLPLPLRQEFASKKFSRGAAFSDLLRITPWGLNVDFEALQASGSYQALMAYINQWQESASHGTYHHIHEQAHALGLLVDQDTAKACLGHLVQLGLPKTDPALSVLTLNALLDDRVS